MDDLDLPAAWSALEGALGAREVPALQPALRGRILAAAARARTPSSSRRRLARADFWTFAAGVAAAILLWINFSMSAVNDTSWGSGPVSGEAARRLLIAQVREALPGISDHEASLHAFGLEARAALIPSARTFKPLGGVAGLEEDPWAMR